MHVRALSSSFEPALSFCTGAFIALKAFSRRIPMVARRDAATAGMLALGLLLAALRMASSHYHNVTVYCSNRPRLLVGYHEVFVNNSYIDENGTFIQNYTYVNESFTYNHDIGVFGPPAENISVPLNCTPCLPGHYCPGNGTLIPCPSGTFGDLPNQTNATFACPGKCAPGRYSGDAN